MNAPAKSSDLADAYGLLEQQERTLAGLRAVLAALGATPDASREGLLTAARELAMCAQELCSFAQGEIESVVRARREGGA